MDASPPGTSAATLDDDYAVASNPGERNILVQFNSFEDSLPIPFEVFDDSVVEGPEAFQLQSSRNQVGPIFSAPDEATVFSSTFVQVLDSGSKFTFCSITILCFSEYTYSRLYKHRWYTQASHGSSNCIGP